MSSEPKLKRLRGGRIFCEGALREWEVRFDAQIREVGPHLTPEPGEEVIELEGMWVLPGLIDTHVHFRDFAQAHKETWQSGGRAALRGGVTTVFEMPNTDPPTTTRLRVLEKAERAQGAGPGPHFGLWVGVSEENLDRLEELAKLPYVIGFKLYMVPSGGELALVDPEGQRLSFEAVAPTGRLLAVHAEEAQFVEAGRREDPACEGRAVARALELAARYGVRLHLAHLSTAQGVARLREAKSSGLDVSAEATPHHLLLTSEGHCSSRRQARVNPPLRTEADRYALWEALAEGVIDWIASDHAPHTPDDKARGAPGFPGVETLAPLLLNEVLEDRWTLPAFVEACAGAPARRFHLDRGAIRAGAEADLTVVDPFLARTVRGEELASRCGWSPYEGRSLRGWPALTVVSGEVRYRRETAGSGSGSKT